MNLSRNRTGYYIKEGFGGIFAHGFMSFASVCIIVAFLLIMGSFVLIAVNINAIIGVLESENIVLAFVHADLPESRARELESNLLSVPNVSNVTFITREEALEDFLGIHGETERFADVDATWFRHRYSIYVEDVALIGETHMAISNIWGIARVNANLTIAQGLVTVRNIVSGVSVVIIAILLLISLFIMSNTIKLSTFERREEIAIMRMVGATNSFIRWPFIFQGFTLGVSGALVSFAGLWALYNLVANRMLDVEAPLVTVVPFANISLPLFMVFVAIGFGVGVGGSAMALNKYLKV